MVRKYFPNQGIFASLQHSFFLLASVASGTQCFRSSASYSPLERMRHKQNILFIHHNRQGNNKQFTTLHASVSSSPARSKPTAEARGRGTGAELGCAREVCAHSQPSAMNAHRPGERGQEPQSRVLGQDLGCPVRDSSPGLGISPPC